MDADPVSPLGMWRYSKEFLKSARTILPPPTTAREIAFLKYNGVAYYLLGHSIELSLKAFLLCRGTSIKTLRQRPFGHNLFELRKEASRRKLGREVTLSKPQKAVIDYFSESYESKRHEYFERGILSVPRYVELHSIATILVDGLYGISRDKTTAAA